MPHLLDTAVIVAYLVVITGAGYCVVRRPGARRTSWSRAAGSNPSCTSGRSAPSFCAARRSSAGSGPPFSTASPASGWSPCRPGRSGARCAVSTRLSWLGIYTVSAALEHRYGRAATLLISALVVAAYALMTAVTSMTAAGAVFDVVLGLSPTVAIVVAGGIVVAYSAGADPAGGVEHWWVFQPEEVPRSATPLVRRDPRRTGRYRW